MASVTTGTTDDALRDRPSKKTNGSHSASSVTSTPLLSNRSSAQETLGHLENQPEDHHLEGLSFSEGSATMMSCISNLSNTILGTGMLAMAHGFAQGGWFIGSITVVGCGSMAYLGLHLLTLSAGHPLIPHRASSFSAISKITYPKAGVFFDAAIAVKCFGVSISYLLIFGRLMPQVILSFRSLEHSGLISEQSPSMLLDRRLWITIAMIAIVPLSFLKSLHSLRYTSYIALIAVVDLLIVVVYKFFDRSGLNPPGKIEFIKLSPGFVTALPLFIFANSLEKVLSSLSNRQADEIDEDEEEQIKQIARFVAITFGLLLSSFLIAVNVERLESVLGFVGSTGSTTISYILPGFFFLKLFPLDHSSEIQISYDQLKWLRRGAKMLIYVGFLVMIVCLSLNIHDVFLS